MPKLYVNVGRGGRQLSLFQSLHQEAVKTQIPLGSEGVVGGTKYVVIGFMERYAKWMGNIFPWSEYLLYNRDTGYRWLICNEGHWSLAAPVNETPKGNADVVSYDGDRFRIYDRGTAHVRYLLGEFYWKVNIGDVVQTSDYICPPRMLSYERSGWGKVTGSNDFGMPLHYTGRDRVDFWS